MAIERAILLRHGQTEWNLTGRWQGQTDTPLNEVGRAQASIAAERLAAAYPDVAHVVTSDLQRAADTARKVAHACDAQLHSENRFREFFAGKFEGLSAAAVDKQYGAELAAMRAGEDVAIGVTGERLTQVQQRTREAFDHWAEALSGTVVFVGHGGSWRLLLSSLMDWPLAGGAARVWVMRNCHWAVMRPGEAGWTLRGWNIGADDGSI